jgi:hypothetical protein
MLEFFDPSVNNTDVTLAEFVEAEISRIAPTFNYRGQVYESTILESNATTLSGNPAHKLIWEERLLDPDDASAANRIRN